MKPIPPPQKEPYKKERILTYKCDTLSSKKRFIYRGYLQIAELDANTATESHPRHLAENLPLGSQRVPTATRILALTSYDATGTYEAELYYTHDAQKNTTALFGIKAGRRALYQYGAYGNLIKIDGEIASLNPFRFSSEYHDDELALIYYNYRYLNPKDGRWINRDMVFRDYNEYLFVGNSPSYYIDVKGQEKAPTAFQTYPVNPTPQPRPMPTPSNTANAAGSALAEVIDISYFFKAGWLEDVKAQCINYCRDYIQKEKITERCSCCHCSFFYQVRRWGMVGINDFTLYLVKINPNLTCETLKKPSLSSPITLYGAEIVPNGKTKSPVIGYTYKDFTL